MSKPIPSLSKDEFFAARALASMLSKDRRQMLKIDSILNVNQDPLPPSSRHNVSSNVPSMGPSSIVVDDADLPMVRAHTHSSPYSRGQRGFDIHVAHEHSLQMPREIQRSRAPIIESEYEMSHTSADASSIARHLPKTTDKTSIVTRGDTEPASSPLRRPFYTSRDKSHQMNDPQIQPTGNHLRILLPPIKVINAIVPSGPSTTHTSTSLLTRAKRKRDESSVTRVSQYYPHRQPEQFDSELGSALPSFEIGTAVQIRHLVQDGSVNNKRTTTWGEWYTGVVVEYRMIGNWVKSLNSIPATSSKMEYKVRVYSSRLQPPFEKWYRSILGEIRRPETANLANPGLSNSIEVGDAESSNISAEEAMHRTMLWARFSNLFPRNEAFRLRMTRWSEVTSSSPAAQLAPSSRSSIADSPQLDSDSDLDSSGTYTPFDTLISKPAGERPKQRSYRSHSNLLATGKAKEESKEGTSHEMPYFADIWLPFQVEVWNEHHPQGKILLPCLDSSSLPSSSSDPATVKTLFTPTEYTSYSQSAPLAQFSSDNDTSNKKNTRHSTRNCTKWLYDASVDRFVLVSMQETQDCT